MNEVYSTLTVYFDEPFWIGVYERVTDGSMQAAKITFGSEPKDYEVYEFILQNFYHMNFGPTVLVDKTVKLKINPKRMQRAVGNQLEKKGVGTKAQEALKLQHEERKKESGINARIKKEEYNEKQFALRQAKKKEKHRGR
ncbi:MAG: YjdF family protein [Eubacteriales bacterium]